MGILFSKVTQPTQPNTQSQHQISNLKRQIDKIDALYENHFLQSQDIRTEIKFLLRQDSKTQANLKCEHLELVEHQLSALESQKQLLSDLIYQIELAAINKDVVKTIQQTNLVLEKYDRHSSKEKIERVYGGSILLKEKATEKESLMRGGERRNVSNEDDTIKDIEKQCALEDDEKAEPTKRTRKRRFKPIYDVY